jgi:hypothetical protein
MHTKFWSERDHSTDTDIREDNIKMKLKDRVGGCELDSCGSREGPLVSPCEHGNEPSDSKKGREFID